MNKDNNNGLLYTLSELILNNPYAIEEGDVPLTQHEVVVLLNKKNNQIRYLEEKLDDERIAIIKKDDEINELKKVSQDYEDIVANFFWENWLKFDEKLQEEIILLFDVDGDMDD